MKLRIDKAIYGGNGLARIAEGEQAGKAVFVPFALPGELVEVSLRSSKKGFSEAELVDVLERSSDRVAAKCKHFGSCGGCQYQHADYPAQVEIKKAILAETLQRAKIAGIPDIQAHSAEPWGYRNRIRMRLEGRRVGYNRRASNVFLPVEECPIASSLLWRAAQSVAALDMQNIAEVELFANADQSELQVTLFALRTVAKQQLDALATQMKSAVPELRGVGIAAASQSGRGHRDASDDATETVESTAWGETSLAYRVDDDNFAVPRGAFFQVNRYLIDRLVELATEGREGKTAWDLYAGVGLFSSTLLKSFEAVTAVEIGAASYSALVLLMQTAGKPHRAVQATTLNFLRKPNLQAPDLIVVDPPRAGLGADVVEQLNKIGAPQIVYISCDPSTLSRDLAGLLQSGYTLAELHLVDLFPQTFHLETVAILKR